MTRIGSPEEIGWLHQRGHPGLDSSGFWQSRICALFSVAGVLRASGVDPDFGKPERLERFLRDKYFDMLDGDRLMKHGRMAEYLRQQYGATVVCRNILQTEHNLELMAENHYAVTDRERQIVEESGHMGFADYFEYLKKNDMLLLTSMRRGFAYFPPPAFNLEHERWLTHGSSHPVMPVEVTSDEVLFYDVMEPYHLFGDQVYERYVFSHSAQGSVTSLEHYQKYLNGPTMAIGFSEA